MNQVLCLSRRVVVRCMLFTLGLSAGLGCGNGGDGGSDSHAGGRPPGATPQGEGARMELLAEKGAEALLVSPIWAPAGSMISPRSGHTATLLNNGKVLVAGGNGTSGELDSAELYDPATNSWTAAGPLNVKRSVHTATLLGDKVLVVGGLNSSTGILKSAELYDPATNSWTPISSLIIPRFGHTATLLGNGKVLVVGGDNGSVPYYLKEAELYNPATNSWTTAAIPLVPRSGHTATLLDNGKVLVAGGNYTYQFSVGNVDLYDPATNTWTDTGLLNPRFGHTATLLGNGEVLIAGGIWRNYGTDTWLTSVGRYNPTTNTWTSTASMPEHVTRHTATLLDNGKVLVAGGQVNIGTMDGPSKNVYLYDPGTDSWSHSIPFDPLRLGTERASHTATRLVNGKVLVAGGDSITGKLASSELYTLPLSSPCTADVDCQSGFCVDGVCCNTACGGGVPTDCQACNMAGFVGACSPSAAGAVCRASASVCDVAESCDGTNTVCPADLFEPAGKICRLAAGACDVAESCTGSSRTCPSDGFVAAGTVCRAQAGVCDVAEVCTGISAACAADRFAAASTVCRAAAGICDVAENCTGSSAACPVDVFVPAGNACLNTPGLCDPAAHSCTGSSAACP